MQRWEETRKVARTRGKYTRSGPGRMEAEVKANELQIKAGKLELERLELENNINLKKEEIKTKTLI